MDAAILHALVQICDIKVDLRNGFGERDQVWRAAGRASQVGDLEDGHGLERGRMEGLGGRRHPAGEDGDLTVLDLDFDSALLAHDTPLLLLFGPARCGLNGCAC